ncbi:4564_t:CDS:2 [Funneliformis geosporum]|nr:4564_t:CDS:2 [Funneliformis geosporum]
MDNHTFSPLEIVPKHQFVAAQSIKVTKIPLDITEHRIRTVFSKLEKIIKLTMNTKNLWQQGHGLFVLNDIVKYHICDLPKKDILAKSKFSAKLARLPRFTTGKQLIEIGHSLNATA